MRGEYETREIRNFAFLYKFREFVLIFIFGPNQGRGVAKSDRERTGESTNSRSIVFLN